MEDLKQTETPAQLIMRALLTHHNRTYNDICAPRSLRS